MRVSMPLLSRKSGTPEYAGVFENVFRACVVSSLPAGVFTRFFPYEVTRVALGEKWLGAIPIVEALGLLAMLIPIGNCLSVNLVVFRKTRAILWVSFIALVLALSAYLIGINYSPAVFAELYGWTMGILIAIYCFFVTRISPLKMGRLLKILLSAVVPMAVGVGAGLLGKSYFFTDGGVVASLAIMGTFCVVYLAALFVISGYHRHLKELMRSFGKGRSVIETTS